MTLYHFGNCLAIIYVPYYLTYKYSSLSDYGAFWKCIQAGLIYMLTQLCKMLILATFFPENTLEADGDYIGELLKNTVDLADLVGFYVVLSKIPGKGHSKVLTAGVGWATAEVILSRAVLLWVKARGVEFDWIYILKCFESNILLVQHIASATLIWLWSRHDVSANLKTVIALLLVVSCYKSGLINIFLKNNTLLALIIKGMYTLIYSAFTLAIYGGLSEMIGIV